MAIDLTQIATVLITTVKELSNNKGVKSFLCGTYTDGTPRNLTDAMNGEYLSPKTKKKKHKKKKHHKNKKNKRLKYNFKL